MQENPKSRKQFQIACQKKQQLSNLSYILQETIMYMDYKIRKQNQSFNFLLLCGGGRENFKIQKTFQRAFQTLKESEKIEYFCNTIDYAEEANSLSDQQLINVQTMQPLSFYLCIIKKQKKIQAKVQINQFRVISMENDLINLDIRNYFLRKSKKKEKNYYILEAIKRIDPETIRFQFTPPQDQSKNLRSIKERFKIAHKVYIYNTFLDLKKRKKMLEESTNTKQNFFKIKMQNSQELETTDFKEEIPDSNNNIKKSNKIQPIHQSKKKICEQIIKDIDEQDLSNDLSDLIEQQDKVNYSNFDSTQNDIFSKRLFRSMVPHHNLDDLTSLLNYGSIYKSNLAQLFIYRNTKNHQIHKMQMSLSLPIDIVCRGIYNVQLHKYWHPEIEEAQVTLKITSQNSYVVYIKQQPFSQWYRSRDYLILFHLFKTSNSIIIVGKSIQNARYPPFQSITRGNIEYIIWQIKQISPGQCRVAAQISINHEGILNKKHQQQLTMRYLKGFEFMQTYFNKKINQQKTQQFLSIKWIIGNQRQSQNFPLKNNKIGNNLSLKTIDFQDDGSEISQDQQMFYSIQNLTERESLQNQQSSSSSESQHQLFQSRATINQKKLLLNSQIHGIKGKQQIKVDDEGLIVIPTLYLKKKVILEPFQIKQSMKMKILYSNIVTKNDWEIEKGGGLKLINQDKIQAQRNVSKFIIKTMKKNLFSGKGALSISLPVQIFNQDSNLQRLCSSMGLAPQFLQSAVKAEDPAERFKLCIAFGLSTFLLFFDIDKPFNPIIGQTYQGFIRGCPVYAEQISHHPPISSIYLVGRGYKVSASLEGKVSMGMNSGEGYNDGLITIQFDDQTKIQFQNPPAEISGLNMGDIKYNFKGKGYFFDLTNNLFCEMKLQESGGYFSKNKREFIDQITGQIYKVQNGFIQNFLKTNKVSLNQANIVGKYGQLSGRWPLQLNIDQKIYYSVENDLPDKLCDDVYPLPSNSNYREDLFYRKLDNLSKSQLEKQRLEGIQRADKKLREKVHGKSH